MDHGTPDPDRNIPAVRASDAERHATANILQTAFAEGRLTLSEFDERTALAFQARFHSELAELTVDLAPARQPDSARFAHPPAQPQPGAGYDRAPATQRVTGQTGPTTSLAVMSGCDRKGQWTVPEVHTIVAVMGGVALDLSEASLQSQVTTIRAFAFWGGVEIVVPDDIEVHVEGLGLMGGFAEVPGQGHSDPRPVRQAPPGAPVIRITGVAMMGGIGVRRVPQTGR